MAAVFDSAVRLGAARDYDAEQIAAWAAGDDRRWSDRLASRPVWGAFAGSTLIGFVDLEADGHVDVLFVAADCHRRGIASALLAHVEGQARYKKLPRLFTEASLTARPFFARHGFRVVACRQVNVRGVLLDNFAMEKWLSGKAGPQSAPR